MRGRKEDRGLPLSPVELVSVAMVDGELYCWLTPLYLLAHFEGVGFGDEAISAILLATSLEPTGTAFDIVVDIIVVRVT